MVFAATKLLDDLLLWLVIGLVLAAAIRAFVPAGWLESWGGHPLAMLVMVLISIPMYICSVSSTPVAASLILAGVSPGAALVLLLAGPATNVATVGVLHKEMGLRVTVVYFASLALVSIAMGLLTDWVIGAWNLSIVAQVTHGHASIVPQPVAVAALVLLVIAAIRPARRWLLGWIMPRQNLTPASA